MIVVDNDINRCKLIHDSRATTMGETLSLGFLPTNLFCDDKPQLLKLMADDFIDKEEMAALVVDNNSSMRTV